MGIAYPRAFTPQNILSGFRKSGIYPLDTAIFTDDDFLSAYVTDRVTEKLPSEEATARPDNGQDESGGQKTSSLTNLDEPTPGTSSNPHNNTFSLVTPNTKREVMKIVTPEEVQPYPKAVKRKKLNRGRKAGKTMIATDTPEKHT